MAFWGPIIGAGVSLLGSLFGGGGDEETRQEIDYGRLAYNAEKAGFNPLTALRSGGGAGFTVTHHPGLSMETRLGNAFSTLGNAIMSFDSRADERAELEQRMMEAQLTRLNLTNEYLSGGMAFGNVPAAAGATVVGPGGKSVGVEGSRSNPKPMYEYYVDDLTKRVHRIASPGLPDLEQVTIPPLEKFGTNYEHPDSVGIPSAPRPNPKPQGNPPGTAFQLPGLAMPADTFKDVEEFFKPWKGVFW